MIVMDGGASATCNVWLIDVTAPSLSLISTDTWRAMLSGEAAHAACVAVPQAVKLCVPPGVVAPQSNRYCKPAARSPAESLPTAEIVNDAPSRTAGRFRVPVGAAFVTVTWKDVVATAPFLSVTETVTLNGT